MANHEVTCPYCYQLAELVDSKEVYRVRSYGMIWLCRPCDAYVGCHKNSPTHAPLGRLADAELRAWKMRAHAAFDPIWKWEGSKKAYRPKQRKEAYAWLAGQLGIDVKACHIGMFDVATCVRVEQICRTFMADVMREAACSSEKGGT